MASTSARLGEKSHCPKGWMRIDTRVDPLDQWLDSLKFGGYEVLAQRSQRLVQCFGICAGGVPKGDDAILLLDF